MESQQNSVSQIVPGGTLDLLFATILGTAIIFGVALLLNYFIPGMGMGATLACQDGADSRNEVRILMDQRIKHNTLYLDFAYPERTNYLDLSEGKNLSSSQLSYLRNNSKTWYFNFRHSKLEISDLPQLVEVRICDGENNTLIREVEA